MTINAFASWRHFADHLLPIWRALPDELRGSFYAPRDVIAWHPKAGLVEGLPRDASPVLVAGFGDHHTVRPRRTILVNHGAGQTYGANPLAKGNEAFSGGPGRERVILHLEPGQMAARASQAAGHRFAEVGMPFLDPWHHTRPIPQRALVAVALHHNGRGAPEQMPAWPHYAAAFALLADSVELVGHGHPRGWERVANQWARLGVTPEPDFARVLDRAALLVTDISSAGPMFASTRRPVVWLSAPWHLSAPASGGRFHAWTEAVEHAGGHVTDPDDLVDQVRRALAVPEPIVAAQQPIIDDVFCATDGGAAERAVAAICQAV